MSPKPTPGLQALEQYVFRGILALAGASLGINSYLVKEKVSEIGEDLKSMAASIKTLEVHTAVAEQKQTTLETRLDQTDSALDRLRERLQSLEVAMSKVAAKFNVPFGSRAD